MEEDKTPAEAGSQESASLEAPAESPSLEANGAEAGAPAGSPINNPTTGGNTTPPPKKPGGLKALLKRVNVYLLGFIFLLVVAGVISIVTFLNSKKPPDEPNIVNKNLTSDELKQLANSNATVGDTGQTLTVQGNAIFSGQVLVRSDLNVAGAIKLGGDLTTQNFTASGTVNLADTQIQSLQVAKNSTLQGTVTVQHDLNVAGVSSFNGAITAHQLTVTNLILSGNARLSVPNHVTFPGASPTRSVDHGVLGSGGSASISGSDTAGTANINTGSGTSSGCFITLTFNKPFSNTPHVVVTPVGSAAGKLDFYVNRSRSNFSICTGNAAPTRQNFAFDYFITD